MPDNAKDSAQDHIPSKLIELGDFAWPQGETRQTLTHILDKVREELLWGSDDYKKPSQKLHSIVERDLMDVAHQHLSDILNGCLDATYFDWIKDDQGAADLRAFVYSPMPSSQLKLWAEGRGMAIVETLDDLSVVKPGSGVVVPHFGKYLHRQQDKLCQMRDVLAQLAKLDARVIIGCNSWAWRYAVSATSADTVVSHCYTMPAFGGLALADLMESVISQNRDASHYVSEETQDAVFQRDGDGQLEDPYFTKLAKRSLGLPWVAIEMFFDDLRAEDEVDDTAEDRRIWLSLPPNPRIPAEGSKAAPMALQNLLIHEPCSKDQIDKILPEPLPPGMWTSLLRAGFILSDGDLLRHNPSHYPAMRSFIGSAGLNLDRL